MKEVGVAPIGSWSWALIRVKDGARLARSGWNGKGQWIELQVPDAHSKMTRPYFYIHTVNGDLVPWVPSVSDNLADDWEELE